MALLREVYPNGASIGTFDANLAGNKRVIINVNGEAHYCSPKLSKLIRDKEVSLSQLGDYMVRNMTSSDGEVVKSLGLVGESFTVDVTWKASAPKKEFDLARLAELVAI